MSTNIESKRGEITSKKMNDTPESDKGKMTANSKGEMTALTIGRWEPPHKGHSILIKATVEKAREFGGTPYVWLSPCITDDPDHEREGWDREERTISDPLSVCQRIYYLHKQYPKKDYPKLMFLTDVTTPMGIEFERELKLGKSELTHVKGLPANWDHNLTTNCIKYKYISMLNKDSPTILRVKQVRDRSANHKRRTPKLPSHQCLQHLSHSFKKVNLLVGSDRFESFKKYNDKKGEKLFPSNFEIIQVGEDRGKAGLGMAGIEEGERKTPTTTTEATKDGVYSGSRTRNFAYKGDVLAFIDCVKIGDMNVMDCYCLMNDIRTGPGTTAMLTNTRLPGSGYKRPITEEEFYDKLSEQDKKIFETTVASISKWEKHKRAESIKLKKDRAANALKSLKLKQLNTKNIARDRRQTRRQTRRERTRKAQEEKQGGGKRRRKTRKKKKRKTRKKNKTSVGKRKRNHKKRRTRKHRKHRKKSGGL